MYQGQIELSDQPLTVVGRRPAMQPVVVGPCFGWLHPARGAVGRDVAVLICAGLNRDLLDAHHSLRMLADEFAAAGYPAMRIDYPGIGDSADVGCEDSASVELWTAWQSGIRAALDWLRATTGARHVVLCGLRIGATLATLAAEGRPDVKGLLLLAPVLRGKSYLQQLHMEARLQRAVPPLAEGLEFFEARFSAETVALISAVDLRRAKLLPGLQLAMFEQAASKLGEDCAAAWSAAGASVARPGFDGLAPLLRHNEEAEGTPADFSQVMEWLRRAVPGQPMAPACAPLSPPALAQPGWIETPQHFGPGDGLFGVLCRPDRGPADTAVVIVNTGRDPHYGAARFGVEFARDLAGVGIASFRIDFAGLGDSIGPPGKETVLTSMFGTGRTADIVAAADFLRRLGYRRLAVHGNCSGAYHALHGALADPRLDTLLLMNLPVFEWRSDHTVDFVYRRTAKPSHYLRKFGSKNVWKRLLEGSLDISGIVHAQTARMYAQVREAGLRAAERRGWAEPRGVGRRAMASLARRGARTLFLFSSDENGMNAMEEEFGRRAVGLQAFAGAELRTAPELDHLLSTRAMRQMAIEVMARFLLQAPTADVVPALGARRELPVAL